LKERGIKLKRTLATVVLSRLMALSLLPLLVAFLLSIQRWPLYYSTTACYSSSTKAPYGGATGAISPEGITPLATCCLPHTLLHACTRTASRAAACAAACCLATPGSIPYLSRITSAQPDVQHMDVHTAPRAHTRYKNDSRFSPRKLDCRLYIKRTRLNTCNNHCRASSTSNLD